MIDIKIANLMDYGTGTKLRKYQWNLIHNPPLVIGLLEDEGEGALVNYVSNEIIELLLESFRTQNVQGESRLNVDQYAFTNSENYDIDLGDTQLSYLSTMIDGNFVQDEDPIPLEVMPFQQDISSFDSEESETYLKYKFYRLNENDDNFEPAWGMADRHLVEFIIKREDKYVFENYVYNSSESLDNSLFKFIVSDDEALIRNQDSPFGSLGEYIPIGSQTAILDTLGTRSGATIVQVIVKSTSDTVATSVGNLTEVITIEEKEYTMREDFTALYLPYSSEESETTYYGNSKFSAYKECGNFIKVKGYGDEVEGHWIPKFRATRDPDFPITTDDLHDIFPNVTDTARITDVVNVINKYSNDFEINSATRMAHFLGQIGAETQLTSLLEESYSASTMKRAGKTRILRRVNDSTYVLKYCDIWTGYSANSSNTCPFPHCTPTIEIPIEETYIEGTIRYVNRGYMSDSLTLTAKAVYTNNRPNNTNFFDYVYACQLGNGTKDSHDGSRFRGRGFIQLTGFSNYSDFQDLWNQTYGSSNQKDFICRSAQCDQNLEELNTNMETAMLAAFVYWEQRNVNSVADNGISNANIDAVTVLINGGLHGQQQRRDLTSNALTTLDQ
jgi:predicted chitinase